MANSLHLPCGRCERKKNRKSAKPSPYSRQSNKQELEVQDQILHEDLRNPDSKLYQDGLRLWTG